MAEEKTQKKVKKAAVRKTISQRVTEKGALQQARRNVYVLNVLPDATKKSIAHALKKEHKITPLKIRLLRIPTKKVFYRGKPGVKGGGKKAYVYLKKGDTLAI
ncbi:MAG: 50S ribosomal protein L23 [Parcubacteria group bacterium]